MTAFVLVTVPAASVRPDEPRWWCEDGERVGDLPHVTPSDLHTESLADCGLDSARCAVVVRAVRLDDEPAPGPYGVAALYGG